MAKGTGLNNGPSNKRVSKLVEVPLGMRLP
jgi:hypothetical protein